jgi:hypothetical protein
MEQTPRSLWATRIDPSEQSPVVKKIVVVVVPLSSSVVFDVVI